MSDREGGRAAREGGSRTRRTFTDPAPPAWGAHGSEGRPETPSTGDLFPDPEGSARVHPSRDLRLKRFITVGFIGVSGPLPDPPPGYSAVVGALRPGLWSLWPGAPSPWSPLRGLPGAGRGAPGCGSSLFRPRGGADHSLGVRGEVLSVRSLDPHGRGSRKFGRDGLPFIPRHSGAVQAPMWPMFPADRRFRGLGRV